ncbi:hypothetical protein [Kineococcus radiotolerans]|uniref:Uncharacterized protein n=1 Tax=Kineococcus radiotolerans (strain ATCC BAA-149 / DSM 14245 / SRS30216) TaxID=266940 RepID=A6W8J3_KINRD|nr:hypothetical protein [Kineococcus radiotolerans]ABS03132.1 hypothetical protein Krad_1646 [Kineococcus radiotolerans SRS30216 = ATCC BAA-149]
MTTADETTDPGTAAPAETVERFSDAELGALAIEAGELAAAEPAEHRATALGSLAAALRAGADGHDAAGVGQLRRWADADLFEVLDVDAAVAPLTQRRSLLRSGSLRTILVFAPVMVTWVGLLFAGRAYGDMSAAGEATDGESFLQLWLDGFGGRTAFSLDHVAEMAVVLIAGAIAISVATDRRQRADEVGAANADEAHRRLLRGFAARATVALAPHRANAAEQLGAHFERGLTELGRLVAETIRLHADTSALVATVRSSSETAIVAANAANTGGADVARAALELQTAVTAAVSSHGELIAADREQHTRTLAESTETIVGHLAQVREGTAEALREGLQGRDRVLSAVEGVSASIELLSSSTRESMAALTTSAEAMTRHGADFGERVTGHVAALSTSAKESVETMHRTVVESVEKVTRMTGEAFSEHVAASAEHAATTMETLRRDVERTSAAAESALGTASRVLATAAEAAERRTRHEERLSDLLTTQNEVLDSWRGIENRLVEAAHDMRSVPRWMDQVQHEHADATGRALRSIGDALREDVTGAVSETLAMASDDHVRQVNRAYRDASRQLTQDLTQTLGSGLGTVVDQVMDRLGDQVDQLPERIASATARQQRHQVPAAAPAQHAPAQHAPERRPQPAPERRPVRPEARAPQVQPRPEARPEPRPETRVELPREERRPVRPAEPELHADFQPEEQFVAVAPRTLQGLAARRYSRAGQ